MDFDSTVCFDMTQLAELGHELIDARSRRADHICERLLRDRYGNHVRLLTMPGIRQRQQYPRQPLFTRIEQLVEQIVF